MQLFVERLKIGRRWEWLKLDAGVTSILCGLRFMMLGLGQLGMNVVRGVFGSSAAVLLKHFKLEVLFC